MFPHWQSIRCPVVGMLHIPPLPGAPRHAAEQWDRDLVHRRVLLDAEQLLEGGVQGLILENYGDVPFYPDCVPASTIAEMSVLASEVKRFCGAVPLGINVLRNDASAALAVAGAAGGQFIRVNVLSGTRVTDQGILHGQAHHLLRLRQQWALDHIQILADVDVKHSAPLASYSADQEAEDLVERCGADGVIISGTGTGKASSLEQLGHIKLIVGSTPVWVGSGVNADNIRQFHQGADGLIIGSAFQRDGRSGEAVQVQRVRTLLDQVKGEE